MYRTIVLIHSILWATFLVGCEAERGYPNRPIILICPWAAGGGTDAVSRLVAARLEKEMGVAVNVVNAVGGAGVTGHTRGAKARPDGYTLTMMTVEINMLHHRGMTGISHKDFQPAALLNRDAAAIFVRSDSPWTSLDELENEIRQKPGKLTASGTATGGIWHLALAGWLKTVGLDPADVKWVPNNGANPSLQKLQARGLDMVCCSLPEAQSFLEDPSDETDPDAADDTRLRALGVMSEERVPGFPDVRTFREQGADWTLSAWRGIGLPKDTPPQIAARIVDGLRRVAHSQEFLTAMGDAGFDATWKPTQEFGDWMNKLDAQFGSLLTSPSFRSLRVAEFSPVFFPALLAVLTVGTCAALVVTGSLRRGKDAVPITSRGLTRLAEIVLWVAAYLILVPWAGFVVTAAALLLLLLLRLGTAWRVALPVSMVVAPLAYLVFAKFLHVTLNPGWLGW
jgi:tripartite-type tricarboxylate transporter receptor subunit TctC